MIRLASGVPSLDEAVRRELAGDRPSRRTHQSRPHATRPHRQFSQSPPVFGRHHGQPGSRNCIITHLLKFAALADHVPRPTAIDTSLCDVFPRWSAVPRPIIITPSDWIIRGMGVLFEKVWARASSAWFTPCVHHSTSISGAKPRTSLAHVWADSPRITRTSITLPLANSSQLSSIHWWAVRQVLILHQSKAS